VNISGNKLPTQLPTEVREWSVADPIGKGEEEFLTARDQIEGLVMRLILDLRKSARPSRPAPALRKVPVRQRP
jgi:hypothetical protein